MVIFLFKLFLRLFKKCRTAASVSNCPKTEQLSWVNTIFPFIILKNIQAVFSNLGFQIFQSYQCLNAILLYRILKTRRFFQDSRLDHCREMVHSKFVREDWDIDLSSAQYFLTTLNAPHLHDDKELRSKISCRQILRHYLIKEFAVKNGCIPLLNTNCAYHVPMLFHPILLALVL